VSARFARDAASGAGSHLAHICIRVAVGVKLPLAAAWAQKYVWLVVVAYSLPTKVCLEVGVTSRFAIAPFPTNCSTTPWAWSINAILRTANPAVRLTCAQCLHLLILGKATYAGEIASFDHAVRFCRPPELPARSKGKLRQACA
jgi:hypothetical protein